MEFLDDARQRIYWKDGTFPDAAIADEDISKLEGATHATDIYRCILQTNKHLDWKV